MVDPHQIYSPIIFVGRQRETSMMTMMMHEDTDNLLSKWMLSIDGQGGVGKTQLLKHFVKVAVDHHMDDAHHSVRATPEPVDLYLSQHQTESGVLKSLADQLGKNFFDTFYNFLNEDYVNTGNEKKLREEFLGCYQKLPYDHIVLLFDTVERTSQPVIRFFREFLPQLRDGSKKGKFGTFVVAAGRKSLTTVLGSQSVESYSLKGLPKEDVQQYFEKLTSERLRRRITPEFVERITVLSKGRPILIALVIDWLNYGNLPQDFPDSDSEEEFEKILVEQVQELRTSEDQSIWLMAHLSRRCDEGFLQAILNFSEEESQDIISKLTRFSFVKTHSSYRDSVIACSLHDEMRDLVKKYVLDQFDPNGDLRRDWSQKAVDYYQKLISETDEKDITYRRILERECLFYWFQSDVDKALEYWRSLYERPCFPYERESLNEEVELFRNRLSVEEHLEIELQKALILYHRAQYNFALEHFFKIIEQTRNEILKAEIYPWIVHSLTHMGDVDEGLDAGKEYESKFESLLNIPHNPRTDEIKRSFGMFLNAVGLAYRSKSDYKSAVDYYKRALHVLECLPSESAYRASIKTNLAFLYHSMGKDRMALAHGQSALRIAEDSGNLRQAGLTHNVLGIIAANSLRGQQAVNQFNCAIDYLSQAQDSRGLAMVKVAMGRMHRQVGWYKVKPDREEFKPAISSYKKADGFLGDALTDIGSSSPEIKMDIYYEKATLFREQGAFDEAIKLYKKSKKIAESIPSPLKAAYNLLGLGVTYDLQKEYIKSREAAREANQFASLLKSAYLTGRVERILSNVLFKKDKDYDQSIKKAINSCINVLAPDLHSFTNGSARKEMLHDEWLNWLTNELIQNLPSTELQISKAEYLIQLWDQSASNNEKGGLAECYPGLGVVLKDLIACWDG